MNIKIIQRQCGGTEFLSQPHRLHLGAQNAAGVDELCFTLPEAWAGCTVALYLRRSDGTLLAPVSLDTQHCVTVDRRLTGSTGGQWMLAAIDASGYAVYTRPGSYDTYAILPIDGGAEELPPSQYEQFVARVLESASTASTAAQRAAASAASTASNAAQAQTAAQRTSADSAAASRCAARAEAAAARAEELVPKITQKIERMVLMMAMLWAQEIMSAETVEDAKALYERCPRLLKEKVKAILIKSGFEEITQ